MDIESRDHTRSRFVRSLAAYDALNKMQAWRGPGGQDHRERKQRPDVAPAGSVLELYVHDWVREWLWVEPGVLDYTERVLDATDCLRDLTAECEDTIAGWDTDSPDYWAMEMPRSVEVSVFGYSEYRRAAYYSVCVTLAARNEGGRRLVFAEAQIVGRL